ncbi:hypothetical protein [Palleronia abyssalis]|uniref:Uncharacterized protein n=1 Tax=Palleronia abyssalis TaxID=1501240 RepID=A0A2R8BY18_9RHOB|nr:hypothetical protein [Palleronia abyssalis]SPJ24976.1 hypothetical protein PAA8504_02819 [Palleronia abyssalis]
MIQTLPTPTHPIDALIREHGALPVLRRALRALILRRAARPGSADHLTPYLRKDIGLPPANTRADPWEFMR